MPPKSKAELCAHKNLTFTPSSNAQIVGYKQPTPSQRKADSTFPVIIPKVRLDSTSSRNQDQDQDEVSSPTFPAPLVLPGDELSWDPTYLVQPLRSWYNAGYRNKVTAARKSIYLVRPPGLGAGLEGVKGWAEPKVKVKGKSGQGGRVKWTGKETGDILGYLGAFYHGMEVKMLDVEGGLNFTADVEEEEEEEPQKMKRKVGRIRNAKEKKSPTIWLNTHTSKGLIGIRTRTTPKGAFPHQLNLSDLLEAAMEILPEDAYALVMLVEHDMFEDEEDDFACGRAYGGNRVAVVSVARYDPILDVEQRVERGHGWPASHCSSYIQQSIDDAEEEESGGQRKRKRQKKMAVKETKDVVGERVSPMQAALTAHNSLPSLEPSHSPSPGALSGLWLGRVCRTASHEIGHCFGIDHCVSYACCMQGTARIIEDARQPPYLCPVDLAKILMATGADERERYVNMAKFCGKFPEVQLFKALGAWIEGRVGELDGDIGV